MRQYLGSVSDNARWEEVALRDDDVIITAPTKSGTTWMQTMVGMLLFGTDRLPGSIGDLSPWVDMVTRPIEAVRARLDAQTHRRFLKTHTPLDGLPWRDAVSYVAVARHPLDVAMSARDHHRNIDGGRVRELVEQVAPQTSERWTDDGEPDDEAAYLRWWIDRPHEGWVDGSGSLAELVRQVETYWAVRDRPNVTLVHYDDLWTDLDAQMRTVAEFLGVTVEDEDWPALVDAARLDSMRERAAQSVPESDLSIWPDPARFFQRGGRRPWDELLDQKDLDRYEGRLRALADPDMAAWLSRPA